MSIRIAKTNMSNTSELRKRTIEPVSSKTGIAKKQKTNSYEKKEPYKPKSGIKETDVGITEYVYRGDSQRIKGVLKQRYTDFQVFEITRKNEVLHLNDIGFEPIKKQKKEESKGKEDHDEEKISREKKKPFQLTSDDRDELIKLIGEDDTITLLSLVGTKEKMQTRLSFPDKETRTRVHKLIRKAFNGRFETAKTDDDKINIGRDSFRRKNRRKNNGDGNEKISEPKLKHNLGPRKAFLRFNMYKENKETMEVAGILSRILKIPVKYVRYAGTKDRRGVTVQRASLENVSIERANSLNNILRNCRIGCFEYSDTPINLAALNGNEFLITIRDAEPVESSSTLEEAAKPILDSLRNNGFINYFGMQRFGTFSVSTHLVGKEILNGHWKNAAELILSEQEIVVPSSKDARRIWVQTKDALLSLKKMPRKCSAEFSILSRLSHTKKEEDGEYSSGSYFNAIMGIPRNLRIMYGHAYQSYVWNCVASRRIQLYGLKAVPGDIVLIEKLVEDDDGAEDVKRKHITETHVVTEQDVNENKYTIYDIVLPTPGYDVQYPENPELKNVYVDVMKNDGLDPFNMSRRVREFSLPGSYRSVIAKVSSLTFAIRKYDTFTDELVRTDLELLELKKAAQLKGEPEKNISRIHAGSPNGVKEALIVKMQLPSSTYATMALRELIDNN